MANYNKGKIAIPNVTGNIVITITAVPQAQENVFPSKFYDTDGVTLYNGSGYKSGFRFNSSNVETATASSADSITGYLDITGFDKVTVSGAVLSGAGGNKCVFYDANHTAMSGNNWSYDINPNGVFSKDGTGDYTIPADAKYMRLFVNTSCCTGTPPALTVVLG